MTTVSLLAKARINQASISLRISVLSAPLGGQGPGLVKALVICLRPLQHFIKLLWRKVVVEEINRIELAAVFVHLVMAVWACAFSGRANIADNFSAFYQGPT